MPGTSRTDLMLLGLLISRSMHGYEIAETLSVSQLNGWVRLGRTTVYYALGRLERDGFVTRHAERHGGKPERSVYSITDTGRRAFQRSLESALAGPADPLDEFDAALFFADQLQGSLVSARLTERVGELRRRSMHVRESLDQARRGRLPALELVLQRRLAHLQADLDFITDLLAGFDEREVSRGPCGSLDETSLQQVMRNLTSLHRTGSLVVDTGSARVALAFEQGDLYGVRPAEGLSVEDSLRLVFSVCEGRFEFLSTPTHGEFVPVPGFREAILLGCRGETDESLLRRMLPYGDSVLDVSEDHEAQAEGLDLTPDERLVLAEVDGVRSPQELSVALGWDRSRLRAAAYPLWALGLLVPA